MSPLHPQMTSLLPYLTKGIPKRLYRFLVISIHVFYLKILYFLLMYFSRNLKSTVDNFFKITQLRPDFFPTVVDSPAGFGNIVEGGFYILLFIYLEKRISFFCLGVTVTSIWHPSNWLIITSSVEINLIKTTLIM